MKNIIYVPNSLRAAGRELREAMAWPLEDLPRERFVHAWSSVAYLFPGLHPDGFDDADSGWPRVLKRFASEAWRRANTGELADDELYPCNAQWAGLFDRMDVHHLDETERRMELAAAFGDCMNA